MKKLRELLAIAGLSFISALNYTLFVFPNRFAPSGVDGICTMLQDLLQVNMGYLAFLVNIPLIIGAFFILNRDFAIKSTLFVLIFSLSTVLLDRADLSGLRYSTGTSVVLAPLAAGTIRGILYAATLKLNGSAGGIDIISALIKHKNPYLDFMHIIFAINMLIALGSYFVYGMSFEPVICSILYAFVTSTVCNKLRAQGQEAVKFEIFTGDPQALCEAIENKLHEKPVLLEGNAAAIVSCTVSKKTAPYLEELILNCPECAVCKSTVSRSVAGLSYK